MPPKSPPSSSPEIMISTTGWVIDKRISLPTLVTFGMIIAGMIWDSAKTDSRLNNVENSDKAQNEKIERMENNYTNIMVRMATIDERMAAIQKGILNIENKLIH